MSEIETRTLEALQGSPDPNPSSIRPDSISMNARLNARNMVLPSRKNSKRWAGAFKDDPFWDEMMAAIEADRAEIDALWE